MTYEEAAFLLRLTAAIVWTGVFVFIGTGRWDTTPLRRTLAVGSLVALLWAVVYGGAVSAGYVPGDVARTLYTGVAMAILIAGIAVLLEHPS